MYMCINCVIYSLSLSLCIHMYVCICTYIHNIVYLFVNILISERFAWTTSANDQLCV